MNQIRSMSEAASDVVLKIEAHNSSFMHSWGHVFRGRIHEIVEGDCEQEPGEMILISIPHQEEELLKQFMPHPSVETITELYVSFREIENEKPYNTRFAGFVGDFNSWEICRAQATGKVKRC